MISITGEEKAYNKHLSAFISQWIILYNSYKAIKKIISYPH